MKLVGLLLSFVIVAILISYGISFSSTVPAPANATALAQYNNATNATGLVFEGASVILYIFILLIVVGAVIYMASALRYI